MTTELVGKTREGHPIFHSPTSFLYDLAITKYTPQRRKSPGKMAQPTDQTQEKATLQTVCGDEEGRKRVEKAEVSKYNLDSLRYIEKKIEDKGIHRMDRHPADGLGLRHIPKSGHGGKYTWEGPGDIAENELSDVPPAIDKGDLNYVREKETEEVVPEAADLVVGEVEVAKVAETKEGVSRVEVRPPLQV